MRTHAVHHDAFGLFQNSVVAVERLRPAGTQRGSGVSILQEFIELKVSAPSDKFNLQGQHRRYYNVLTQVQLLCEKNKDCCENILELNAIKQF